MSFGVILAEPVLAVPPLVTPATLPLLATVPTLLPAMLCFELFTALFIADILPFDRIITLRTVAAITNTRTTGRWPDSLQSQAITTITNKHFNHRTDSDCVSRTRLGLRLRLTGAQWWPNRSWSALSWAFSAEASNQLPWRAYYKTIGDWLAKRSLLHSIVMLAQYRELFASVRYHCWQTTDSLMHPMLSAVLSQCSHTHS